MLVIYMILFGELHMQKYKMTLKNMINPFKW
jgi:hypothetical protein